MVQQVVLDLFRAIVAEILYLLRAIVAEILYLRCKKANMVTVCLIRKKFAHDTPSQGNSKIYATQEFAVRSNDVMSIFFTWKIQVICRKFAESNIRFAKDLQKIC